MLKVRWVKGKGDYCMNCSIIGKLNGAINRLSGQGYGQELAEIA
jgi:hypothetical protein